MLSRHSTPTLCALLLALAVQVDASSARADEGDDSRALLEKAFAPAPGLRDLVGARDVGKRTYAVLINGDADHFVPDGLRSSTKLVRADARYEKAVERQAMECGNCNVVSLHIQRGGARWYLPRRNLATYLRVFIGGRAVLTRHVRILNAADYRTLAGLLNFTESYFGQTEMNLIFISHGFIPQIGASGDPRNPRPPFAYGFRKQDYGIEEFARSLAAAKLKKRLASITLAACSMADLSLAERLAPYAEKLVAPQFDVLESTDVGFRFNLTATGDFANTATEVVATHLMDAFQNTPETTDAMLEYPVSEITLSNLPQLAQLIRVAVKEAEQQFADRAQMERQVVTAAAISPRISERYLAAQKNDGASVADIQEISAAVRIPGKDPERVDVGRLLAWLSDSAGDSRSKDLVAEARTVLQRSVTVYNRPSTSEESGLNAEWSQLLPAPSRP